jgi:urease accessory protein
MMRTIFRLVSAVVVLLIAIPSPAHAHLTNTGLGPFYDGVAHLLLTLSDLLPIIALSLLAGLRGPRFGRVALFALPISCFGASLAGLFAASQWALPAASAAATIVLGALVAANTRVPLRVVAVLAILLGLLAGALNGIELVTAPASALAAIGVAAAPFVMVAILAGHVSSLRASWARIAVRVAGSWIAAVGLLMLGWAIRGT